MVEFPNDDPDAAFVCTQCGAAYGSSYARDECSDCGGRLMKRDGDLVPFDDGGPEFRGEESFKASCWTLTMGPNGGDWDDLYREVGGAIEATREMIKPREWTCLVTRGMVSFNGAGWIGPALVTLTDSRLLVATTAGLRGRRYQSAEIPVDQIADVAIMEASGDEMLEVIYDGGRARIAVADFPAPEVARYITNQMPTKPRKTPDAPALSVRDPMDQLRKLGELHAAGVVTNEEFAIQKAKLLDRI